MQMTYSRKYEMIACILGVVIFGAGLFSATQPHAGAQA